MFPERRYGPKSLIPILLIIAVSALHSAEQQRGTVPSCAGSASCSGDLSQPLLELLVPRGEVAVSSELLQPNEGQRPGS